MTPATSELTAPTDEIATSTDLDLQTTKPVKPAVATFAVADELRATGSAASTERADRLVAFLRQYGEERVNSHLIDERRSIPPSVILDLGRAGLFGLRVAEAYGGQALSHADTFRVITQATAIDANVALTLGIHNAIGISPIEAFADDRTKSTVLPQLARGTSLATIAASEPGAGSNLQGISTTATKVSGGYVVNGVKCWISLGSWAGHINLIANLQDQYGRAQGVCAFLVEGASKGFTPGPEAMTVGMRGLPQNHIDIADLRLPAGALLGAEGEGLAVAQTAFEAGRAMLAAASLGTMQRCLQLAARFASRRTVATGRLLDNGRTQQILSECTAATRAVEMLVQLVAGDLDQGRSIPPELYFACKIMSTELGWAVVDRSMQLLGARGYLDTNIVARYFRDFRLLRIFEGATEAVTVYVGSLVGKDPVRFHALLAERFGAQSVLDRLGSAYGDILAGVPSEAGSSTARRDRHILANLGGELACWAIMASLTQYTASRTSTELDHYTAVWAERQLADRLRMARDTKRQYEILSPAFLADQINGYSATIGDIQQGLAGEATDLDELLARH
jgi:alkylation response protein AidB-like acyl-CoA dehydrogenase